MFLERLRVRECRSIEDASLDGLSRINVLVGRNNAGKSAFFHALHFLAEKLEGRHPAWTRTIRNANPQSQFAVDLTFRINEARRREFFTTQLARSGELDPRSIERLLNSPTARLVRLVFKTLPGSPDVLRLFETFILAHDGKEARIQQIAEDRSGNPRHLWTHFANLSVLDSLSVEAIESAPKGDSRIQITEWTNDLSSPVNFFQREACQFIKGMFLFAPSRESNDTMQVQGNATLARDGSNLPQALSSIRNNNEEQYNAVTSFLESALPDIGRLHTTLENQMTQVGFRRKGLPLPIPLTDSGTGVQQLLMIAVVLETTVGNVPLAIEEPELNLHPGAQRFLLEKLRLANRQIFLTTHAPVFANPGEGTSIFRIENAARGTIAQRVNQPAALAGALEEIGVRNSDVLLSDAALFVEGPSDASILEALAVRLGISLAKKGISLLFLGGGSAPNQTIRPRREVMNAIRTSSPIPHRFLLDKDERADDELARLKSEFGDALHVLKRRELENYLLVPAAIAEAIQHALSGRAEEGVKVDVGDIQGRLLFHARKSKRHVLLKRIREAFGRVVGGAFPRELAEEVAQLSETEDIAGAIEERLRSRFNQWMDSAKLREIVVRESRVVEGLWSLDETILAHAPGADLLGAIFSEFAIKFDKERHGASIAGSMKTEDIASELQSVLSWEPTR